MKQLAGTAAIGVVVISGNVAGVVVIAPEGAVAIPPGVNAGIVGDPGGTTVTVGGPITMTEPGVPAEPGEVIIGGNDAVAVDGA